MYPNYQEDEVDRYFREQEEKAFKKNVPEEPEESDEYIDYETPQEKMRRQIEHEERVAKCKDLSSKFMWLFMILIAGIVLRTISIGLSVFGLFHYSFLESTSVIVNIIAIVNAVSAVVFGVILIQLGKYSEDFKKAGIFYILSGVCDSLNSATSGMLAFTFGILAAVLSVLYMLRFATAMSASFDNVASYMAITWESFKKAYTYVYAAIAICTLAGFVPVIGLIASVFLILLELAVIGLSIWQLVLIFRSSRVMKQYSEAIFAG